MPSNLFSSPRLFARYAETHELASRVHHASVAVGPWQFELPVIAGRCGGHRGARLPFFDFFEPTSRAIPGSPRLHHVPDAVLCSAPMAEAGRLGAAANGAPYVAFAPGIAWADYVAAAQGRSQRLFDAGRAAQRHRMIERATGRIRYDARSEDATLIDVCFDWKARRYTENAWLFRDQRKRAFFRALHRDGLLEIAALHGGDQPVAVALGMRDHRRFYYWIPAFHPDHSRASPGTHLLELLIQDCHRAGLREFDFLAGLEPYKLAYATDVRIIRPLGRSIAALQPMLRARRWVARQARRLLD